jgi:integrase
MRADVLEIPKKRGEYGNGTIFQRKDRRWQIGFYDTQGRRRQKTFRSEQLAKKALQKFLVLREAGKLDAPESRTRVQALGEAYLRYAKNSKPKSHLWIDRMWRKHLNPFFGDYVAPRVGTDLIEEYIEERKKGLTGARELKRNGTINRELTVLKAMFNRGTEADPRLVERCPRFPAKLRESDPRSGWLNDEQYDALQKHAPQAWLRAMLAIAYYFGLRKAELLRMRVGDIDMNERTIRLLPGTTKNDKGRTIKMVDEVHTLLQPCVEGKKPSDAVLTWDRGGPVKDFRAAWAKMCKAAGVSILLHDFRRAAVRNMMRAGVSKLTAKRISGHASDSVFDRYDIADESDLTVAAEKLQARRGENGCELATKKGGVDKSSGNR